MPDNGKILIVDDHPETSESLRRLFELSGYAAIARNRGRDAMSFMNTTRPACVILDQMMPDMSGLDVLQAMRQCPDLADIPVVFFSAVDSRQIRDEAIRLGANAWVLKGTAWQQILKIVQDMGVPAEH